MTKKLAPDPELLSSLSLREAEVLGLASAGYADKWIAAQLGISANTLRTYWTRIRSKLGELPRTALVAAYVEREMAAGNAAEAATQGIQWEWYANFDRWTFRLMNVHGSPLPLPFGEEVSIEVMLEYVAAEDRGRVRSLIEASQRGQLTVFHFVCRLNPGSEVRLATSLCMVERDDHGRPTGIYGRRVPSLDLRGPAQLSSVVGAWGFRIGKREFWADRSTRSLFHIALTDPDPEKTFFDRIHPQDEPIFRRKLETLMVEGGEVRSLTIRLQLEAGEPKWVMVNMEREEDRSGQQLTGTVLGYI